MKLKLSQPAGIVFGNNSTYGNDEISLITAGQNRLFINSSGNITISQDLTVKWRFDSTR